jgi:uncharacterized membrane-anchored protein
MMGMLPQTGHSADQVNATSARYEISHRTIELGGGLASSGNLRVEASLGGFGAAGKTADGRVTVEPGRVGFLVTDAPLNLAPTVTAIPDQNGDGGATPLVNFTVGDPETPVSQLTVSTSSSDPLLVPISSVQLAGTDGARTVRVFPTPGMTGSAIITLVVADQDGGTARTSFAVTVSVSSPKWVPEVNWGAPLSIVYGTSLGGAQLNATSAVPGSFSYSPAAGAVLAAGASTLSVTFTPQDPAVYELVTKTVSLGVSKAPLTIRAEDKFKRAGESIPVLTASYSGFVNSDTFANLDAPVTISTTATAGSPAGSYPIIASGATSANYAISFVAGTLTITDKALPSLVWAAPTGITYGTPLSNTQLNASADVPGSFAYSPPSGSVLQSGPNQTLAVTFTPSDTATYATVSATVSISVEKAALTVLAESKSKVYGAALPAFTTSYTGFVNGESEAVLTAPTVLSSAATASSAVGSYSITPSGAVAANYTLSFSNGTLTIVAAPLTIRPDDLAMQQGRAVPALTATYSGFVNGDGASSLTTVPTLSTTATSASPPGSYPITASGAASANYTIAYVPGTLTVTAKQVPTLTWAAPAGITYGTPLSATQLSATAGVPGTYAYSPASGTILQVGQNQPLSVTFTPTDTTNYETIQTAVSINVAKATLTITADSKSKVYGAALPALTASYSGFVNGETAAVLTAPVSLSTGATGASPVGSYTITPGGATASNYTISFVTGALTVTPAPLTIRPDNLTMRQGTAVPTLTVAYVGLVNGDTPASLTTAPTLSTTATSGSVIGSYPITASGAAGSNYAISYVAGTLTVTAKEVPTITWSAPAGITYGTALSATQLNATASVPGTFVYNPAAGTVLQAGQNQTLAATFTPTDTASYETVPTAVSINVAKAPLTITADAKSKVYGAALPVLTASYSGFVNGENATILAAPVTLGTTGTVASNVGSYSITPSGASAANYAITFVNGTLSVLAAPLTIRPDDLAMRQGTAVPALTVKYTGFVNGDGASSLTTAPTLSTTATSASPTGAYPITASGAAGSNYVISYVPGTLTVTAKQVPTLTWAAPAGITYGTALSGTQLNATASVPGTFVYSPASGTILQAGQNQVLSVTFTPTDTTSYETVQSTVTINVAKATLTITADSKNKVYGAALPVLTASYSGFVNGETAAVLTAPVSLSTGATGASPVGSYTITPGGATASNYTISFVTGALTVTAAPLSIRPDNLTMRQGTAVPTPASLTTAPTLSTTATSASPIGSYPITASGAAGSNYSISYVAGTLTVTAKEVPTITWSAPAGITYGTVLSATQLNATASVPGTFVYNPAAGTVLQAGQNQTLAATFTPTDTASYETVPTAVSINVAKAPLTIAADAKSKVYGAALPALTANYSGFVNGENATSLTTPVSLSTTATASSSVGGFAITPSGAGAGNYAIEFVNGALTVTPAPLIIKADDLIMHRGGSVPPLTVTYAGLVNGDTSSSLTVPPTLATTATSASPVGTYAIAAGGASGANYAITYTEGTLTITAFNELPAIGPIADQTIDEDTPSPAIVFTVSDLETNAGQLSVTPESSNPALIDVGHIVLGGSDGNRTVTLTPLANQFGSATITLRVSDADGGQTNRVFNLTVRSVNDVPVLGAISNQTLNEASLLTVAVSASNVESATETLVFSLDSGAPTGAAIDSATGVMTWTPTEAQGPGTATITVRVTDNGVPPLSAAQSFTVAVNEVNVGPVLAAIGGRSVDEGSTLSFAISGSDADVPSNTLTYALVGGGPVGASLSSDGSFSWTPTETQGPGSYSVTVQVSDGGNPPLSAAQSFSVTVNEVNGPPTLAPIANRTVNEGSPVTVQALASDSDLPAQTLRYSLGSDAPPGASIDASTGAFSWTPGEEQGPGNYTITLNASDNGAPAQSVSQSFVVTVDEVNVAPFLASINNQSVREGETMTAFVAGADLDRPGQRLTYSLGSAPSGARIDAASGVVTWTPGESDGGTTNVVTVIVTDNGPGNLSASQSFQAVAIEVNSPPVMNPIADRTIKAGSPLSVNVSATDPDLPANALTYSLPQGGPAGASIDPVSGLFRWTPDPLTPSGPVTVTVQVSDNGSPSLSATANFRIDVSAGNSSPNLTGIGGQSVDEGSLLTVNVTATDPEGQSLAYSLDPGAPAGMRIDSGSGLLTWTPSEDQGPGTSSVTVRVTDNGTPPLSATQSFEVRVHEMNVAPVVAAIADQTAQAGSLVTVTVEATDADLPANRLAYGLQPGAPAGAAIDPNSGVFSWTPSLAQAGTTNGITVRVTDNGTPSRSGDVSFTVVVAPGNRAPVLAAIDPQTISEEAVFRVSLGASDPDQPVQVLRYEITGGPAGATIDPATGAFSWSPTEAQGPSTNSVTVKVTDNGTPPLDATGSFTVIVQEVNKPPILNAIADQRMEQGRLLRVAADATDPDLPANTLTYSLGNGAPSGATIDPVSGVFAWTPGVQQAPGTNVVTVRVTDSGLPPQSASQSFTVVVTSINTVPTLATIPNQNVNEGQLLSFTALGRDPDLPAQSLAYSLGAGAPAGAVIDPITGVFSLTPTEAEGPGTNVFSVRVTDDGNPPLRVSQDVRLVINEVNQRPVLSAIADQTLGVGDTLTLQATARDVDLPANRLVFSLGAGAPAGAVIDPASGRFSWTPTAAQARTTNQVTVLVTDDGVPPLNDSKTFSAIVKAGPNVPPSLSRINDQTTPENTPTASIPFRVIDPDTPIGNFTLRAVSSNTALVPVTGFEFAGSGADRTLRITPTRDLTGTATITVEASEPAGGKASVSFGVTVAPVPPEIVRQPADQTILAGSVLTLSVVATGSAPLTYQWSFNGSVIAGATSSVLSIADAQPANAGTYSVEMANGIGTLISRSARVDVKVLLRILEQPQSQTVLTGGNVNLRVNATGTPPLKYQWSLNGSEVAGANGPELSLTGVAPAQAGNYTVAITDATGTVTSQAAVLAVLSPAVITRQPASQTVVPGVDVSFSVEAGGTLPLSYQWVYNGVSLEGATQSTLNLAQVALANAGSYAVVVSNPSGTVTSESVRLNVSQPPVITRQPLGQKVLAGVSVTLVVGVSATPPLTYQWKKNGLDLTGATGPGHTLNNVSAAAAGEYTAVVGNAAGTVTSQGAVLEVTELVTITTQPRGQTVSEGSSFSFSVGAAGTGPLSYQWRKDGVTVGGATDATLRVGSARASDAGGYQVIVRNAAGHVASAVAELTVNVGVTLLAQPQSLTLAGGSSAVFSVEATGTAPVLYQWQYNGVDIPGATDRSLTLAGVQRSNAGRYRAVVRNAVGAVTSADAVLQVLVAPTIQGQPVGMTVDLNGTASFTVAASGDAPLSYQWKRNGVNISGATAERLTLNNVQAADAGGYSVVVQNPGGATTSQSATLTLNLPPLTTGNSPGNVPPAIEQTEGTFNGGNTSSGGSQIARRSPNPGSNSERWFAWRAAQNGIATFNTTGSSFDTVLGVYTGTSPNLVVVASDDDRGGFLSSEVRFNATQGTTYLINVNGFGGATGELVVGFKLETTSDRLPELVVSPGSRVVSPGVDTTFSVEAVGTSLGYQWLKNGVPIPGASGAILTFPGVVETDAGNYTVVVTSGSRTVQSPAAALQVGTIRELAQDKFKAAVGVSVSALQLQSLVNRRNALLLAGGSSATLAFSTSGSAKESGEPNHCGETGGASHWLKYVAARDGVVRFSTEGSDFDTVLAVYEGGGFSSMTQVACDDNSGSDGRTSVVNVPVTVGRTYYVAVDGAGGASGLVRFRYELGNNPRITLQPRSQTVEQGGAVALFVLTSGDSALNYRWLKDGRPVPGGGNPSLQILGVTREHAGRYEVEVSNFAGTVRSQSADLTVVVPLAISLPPEDQVTGIGSVARFAAVISGSEPIQYQWSLNGTPISGATQSVFEVANVQEWNAGSYVLTASNAVGTVETAPVALTIRQALVIVAGPRSVSAPLGQRVSFEPVVSGPGELGYQWRLNGLDLPGATEPVLVIAAVRAQDVGDYTVVASNGAGFTESAPARLSVIVPLNVVEQPKNQTVTVGSSAVFAVRTTAGGTVSYQWKKDGVEIAGARDATYVVASAQESDTGTYGVVLSRGAESVESDPATLSVSRLPVITLQPQSQVVFVGSEVRLEVAATGTGPLVYQWKHEGLQIDGATAATLVLTQMGPESAGGYTVAVRNAAGGVESQLAVLTLQEVISDARLGGGGFGFRLNVPEGRQGRVQVTVDFVEWLDLLPAPQVGTVDVVDPDALTSGMRFYRVLVE